MRQRIADAIIWLMVWWEHPYLVRHVSPAERRLLAVQMMADHLGVNVEDL